MMWSIIRWTMRQRRWSIFWWSVGMIGFVVLTLIFYPSFKDQANQLQKSLGNIPPSAMQLFGGTDFFSPVGYLNSQIIYLMLPLLLTILAIGLGSSLIGREEHDTTIESLLARPISRSRLMLAKASAGALITLFVAAVGTATILVMVKAVGMAVPLPNVLLACAICYLLVLTFGAVAFLLAATGKGRGAALGIATIYAIAGYIIGSLAGTVHWLKVPSVVFPYYYFHSSDILRGTFTWGPVVFYVCLTAGCVILSLVAFRRRDIG
ncbi:MAG TPA: ABC transporter permease subunit [Candidatus Saccharimonadales bacterium]|nr:ABC transporter permease subunit [Candidatus Saccharimonadales bacterium]